MEEWDIIGKYFSLSFVKKVNKRLSDKVNI